MCQKFVLVLLGFWEMVLAFKQITVSCGQLLVEGYQNCTIRHDDEALNYSGPDRKLFPGFRLGLISFTCDNYAGNLISTFDKSCNEFAVEDETNFPFYAGIVAGIILTGLFAGFLFLCVDRKLQFQLLDTGYYHRTRIDSEQNENASTLSTDKKDKDDSEDKEGKKESISSLPKQNETENHGVVNEGFIEDDEKLRSSDPKSKVGLAAAVYSFLLIQPASACDFTLHMNYNEFTTICAGTDCHDTPPYTFSPKLGQKICFEDQFGGVINLNISEITHRSRYELVYYTSNYKTTVRSEGECSPIGNNCNSHSSFTGISGQHCMKSNSLCTKNESSSLNIDRGNTSYNLHQGSKCEYVGTYESNNDRHSSRQSFSYTLCCRYSWQVKLIEKLYPVYRLARQTWTVKLFADQNDFTQESQLTTYDPTYSLQGFRLNTNETITITVVDAKAENIVTHNALILYDEKLYNIHMADKDEDDSFGEVQVTLKKDNITFREPKAVCEKKGDVNFPRTTRYDNYGGYSSNCESKTCECRCMLPESKISSFLANLENFTVSTNYLMRKNDSSIIDTFETYNKGSLKVKIGHWKLNDSSLEKAKCDLEYVMSYGSSSSNKSSYILLESKNVETEGIMPFFSNCTFDKRYLKCDPYETVKLILKEDDRTCYLRIPTLSKSMVIHINYSNLTNFYDPQQTGKLNSASGEGFGSTVTNETFVKTLIITVLLCSSVCLICGVIYRAHKNRKQRVEIHTETETALVQI